MKLDRLLQILATALVIALCVGWIERRQHDREARRIIAMSDRMATLAVADRSARREMLSTRIRLVRHYDDLNRATDLAETAVSGLVAEAADDPNLSRHIVDLQRRLALRQETVEQFKSGNALLQNALARFADLADTRKTGGEPLSGEVIQLMLDPRPDAVLLAQRTLTIRARQGADPLTAQARVLLWVLPAVDEILRKTQSDSIDTYLSEIAALLEHREAELAERRLWQGTWHVFTLAALIGSLSALVWRALERGRRTRRQMEAEHLSASVASHFLSYDIPGEARAVPWALAEIGHFANAAQVLLACFGRDGTRIFSWHLAEAEQTARFEAAVKRLYDRGCTEERVSGHAMDDVGSGLVLHRDLGWPGLIVGVQDGRRKDARTGIGMAVGVLARAAQRDEVAAEWLDLERRSAKTERLQAVGTIASGVAHNFNNIIAAIAGFVEMASGRVRRGSIVARHLGEISTSVQRAGALVDDILSLAGQDSSAAKRINVAALISETAGLHRASQGEQARILVQVDDGLEVMGSLARLQQVLLNIGNNALNADGANGRVAIIAKSRMVETRSPLSHGTVDPGRWCVIEITDEGAGVPPEISDRLFEPFFTTRPGGTGLGLSTAWQIVADHGGTIDVAVGGQGGRFSIWLPIAAPAISVGQGERVILFTSPARAERDEDMLAHLGYEPLYLVDSDHVAQAADALLAVEPPLTHRSMIERYRREGVGVVIAIPVSAQPAWAGVANALIEPTFGVEELSAAMVSGLRSKGQTT